MTATALPDAVEAVPREVDEPEAGGGSSSSIQPGQGTVAASGRGSDPDTPSDKTAALRPDSFDGESPVRSWLWPTTGKIIGSFGKSGDKGIQLAGTFEQPIVAAANGRVVYSGTGLVGYGRLIVLKHNKHFFSAYAHNSRILVEEGDIVRGGQRIALMGSSGSSRVKLHFEIRRNGKPVDPLSYLPRRRI